MADIDVNRTLNDALIKRWSYKGYINIGGNYADRFDTSKVLLKLIAIDYPDLHKSLLNNPTVISTADFENNSAATITREFAYTKEIADTYEWTITAGLTITAGVSAKAGLPIVGEGEVSSSVELKVEGGATTTQSQTVSFSETQTIEVPPNSQVHVKAVMSVGQVKDVPFTAHFKAYGQIGARTQIGTNTWVWQWADLDTGGWSGADLNPVDKCPLDDVDREFTVKGTFNASVGIKTTIFATADDPDAGVRPLS